MGQPHLSDSEIKARQNAAGRFGFTLGCLAAIAALVINLWRAPRPLGAVSITIATLLAALNVPFGVALGLFAERISRRTSDKRGG